jgi:hypothetical protein
MLTEPSDEDEAPKALCCPALQQSFSAQELMGKVPVEVGRVRLPPSDTTATLELPQKRRQGGCRGDWTRHVDLPFCPYRHQTALVKRIATQKTQAENDVSGIQPLPARALAPGLDVPGDHKAQRKSPAAEAACSFSGVSEEPASKIALLNATFGTVLSQECP